MIPDSAQPLALLLLLFGTSFSSPMAEAEVSRLVAVHTQIAASIGAQRASPPNCDVSLTETF